MALVGSVLGPVFGFNPQLPAVSNVQTARLDIDCDADHYYFESPTRLELPNGGVLRSIGGKWPAAASALPANAIIRQHGTTGPGSVLQDNTREIDPHRSSVSMALAEPRIALFADRRRSFLRPAEPP